MGYLNLEKKMMLWCRSLLLGVLIAAVQVDGQTRTSDGFISIDCGATANSTDSITGLPYITDDQFIETGVKYNVSSTNYLNSSLPKQYSSVRSFPDGDRNCYSVKPAMLNNKYLLRASFFYGNYDGKNSGQDNSPLLFDLYIGSSFWKRVNISDPSIPVTYEAITAISAYNPLLPVCLIRSDSSSTPFISLLEMRLLKNTLFPGDLPDYGTFIDLFMRRNLGASGDKIIRYPDDPYDRIWEPMNITLHELSTDKTVEHGQFDQFEVPSVVLQTASVSAGVNDSIQFYVNLDSHIAFFVILHFSELELLPEKDVREVDVYLDSFSGNYTANYAPIYLKSGSVYHPQVVLSQYLFSLNASKRATRPPILNALEIYSGISESFGRQSNLADVEAILKIKEAYKTMNKNWVGDPCVPVSFPWAGLSCREITEEGGELRITAINLSSSGLVGEVSYFFSELTEIRVLDLSYNNLSGRIPNSLAGMPYLGVLNLTGNCITQVPEGLVEKSKEGSLILRFDNNTDTCDGSNPTPGGNSTPSSNSTTVTNKKITAPIVIVLSVVPAFLLLVVVVLILWRIRRKTQAINHEVVQPLSESWQFNVDLGGSQLQYTSHQSSVDHKDNQLHFGSRQFMYAELENITKKFSRTIGKGGFGTVFHGSLEDGTEVAVKICSLSSKQAPNLFLAEVENLSSVRHKNLVSLVGYCMDSGQMAIVYEYMPLGSLDDHLRGKAGIGRVLNWAERLQIIIDAAQGLDYLYNGCPMPIIHRDIKTSNILLGQNLEAKISDFGLSKAFHSDLQSHVSMTAPAFSLGYIDPMCLKTWKFNEKTDVYSFGVVLLEIITGEPPVRHDRDVQLIERVQLSFEAGDINAIVDPKLQGMYNTESVWKVLELAMRCMARDVDQRPKMAEVVTELRERLECETSEKSKSMTTESQSMAFMKKSTIFDPAAR